MPGRFRMGLPALLIVYHGAGQKKTDRCTPVCWFSFDHSDVTQAPAHTLGTHYADGTAGELLGELSRGGAFDHQAGTLLLIVAVVQPVAASLGGLEPFAGAGAGAVTHRVLPVDVLLSNGASGVVFAVADEEVSGAHVGKEGAIPTGGTVMRGF